MTWPSGRSASTTSRSRTRSRSTSSCARSSPPPSCTSGWPTGSPRSTTGAYQLAYDLARRAQRAFAFELGVSDPGIITFGSWDGLHRGLLAGERLSLDLKRLKSAYAERNRRELEITKRVSLNELDPIALLRLQTTGSCEFVIPELVYDLDFPGHYFRRIKTVAVSVPCVVGPYTSVAGTLTLLENSLRASPVVPRGTGGARLPARRRPGAVGGHQHRVGRPGMFELNFRDERYLPFEGAGAISRWRFELPAEFRAFDYNTIADLVLQVRYTARDGGAALKADATDRVRSAMAAQNAEIVAAGDEGRLVRAFSLRHEFVAEWANLIGPPPAPQTISVGIDRFPFLVSDWMDPRPEDRDLEGEPLSSAAPACGRVGPAADRPRPDRRVHRTRQAAARDPLGDGGHLGRRWAVRVQPGERRLDTGHRHDGSDTSRGR